MQMGKKCGKQEALQPMLGALYEMAVKVAAVAAVEEGSYVTFCKRGNTQAASLNMWYRILQLRPG